MSYISDAGIIPAYAGSTATSRPLAGRVADHPRIRGEHTMTSANIAIQGGSSPHTRGAPVDVGPDRRRRRIIPAYAGSTSVGCLPTRTPADHPRIRGEHFSPKLRFGSYAGSSPHTRGARCPGRRGARGARIIPAYAGSTASSSTKPTALAGSSPHTRGARLRGARRHQKRRIIPAYAGSTCR